MKKIEEQELKRKKHYAETVEIVKVIAETPRNNEDAVRRIRFETGTGINITWKPQKSKIESKTRGGFNLQIEKSDFYLIEDLKEDYPVLVELTKLTNKESVSVVMSYMEQEFYNDREQEIETYYFMNDKDMETLYLASFYKTDEKLKQQEEAKKKYAEKEIK